jgi:hypothetical protein
MLLCRKLAKELGVAPSDFIRLYNTRTPDGVLPLLALDLSRFEHLSVAVAIKKAKAVIEKYAARLKVVQTASSRRKAKSKKRGFNRRHLIPSQRMQYA